MDLCCRLRSSSRTWATHRAGRTRTPRWCGRCVRWAGRTHRRRCSASCRVRRTLCAWRIWERSIGGCSCACAISIREPWTTFIGSVKNGALRRLVRVMERSRRRRYASQKRRRWLA
ncbi:hypothetical protein OH77DRAFT_1271000 [Trametes cingulata]|nr:hypothetical protein OH77DRAFT_1271000 [Trametes cingulata]